ncbi:hypothetical protein DITRI_Ditri02bG0040300 [Diplodiscus trichospermus]
MALLFKTVLDDSETNTVGSLFCLVDFSFFTAKNDPSVDFFGLAVMHHVSRSESRFLNPHIEGRNPTTSFRAFSITTSSGKVYQFSIPLRDEYTKKSLYDSKRRLLSPGGPDPRHHWSVNY